MKHLLSLFCLLSLCFSANAQKITGNYEVPDVPDWAKNAVFYQIYPQTFCDSDGDGIGDIQGIISKLDYVKSLGVDAIWFNPFFDSPFLDAGYDIRDYYRIAPRYGTNEDAKKLFEENLCYSNGEPVKVVIEAELPEAVITGEETASWSGTATLGDETLTTNVTEEAIEFTVVNIIGRVLPGTGGMGTALFTVLGIAMISTAAVVAVVYKKRRND